MWRKGTLIHCWWKSKLIQPLWRTVWRFLKKNKIGAGSVCGVRVGVVQGSVQRGGLGGLPTPHGPVCRAHARYPAFAPGSSEVAAGFFIFLYLVVHNLPQLHMHTVIFSPL